MTVKELLHQLAVSQGELARQSGANRVQINTWINGRGRLPEKHYPGVAGALGISVVSLKEMDPSHAQLVIGGQTACEISNLKVNVSNG